MVKRTKMGVPEDGGEGDGMRQDEGLMLERFCKTSRRNLSLRRVLLYSEMREISSVEN